MKVISKINGGLGNQMFQYACGRAVAKRINANLYLDLSWYDIGNRTFMLNAFPNMKYSVYHGKRNIIKGILHRLKLYRIEYINEQEYSYWSGIESIKTSSILSGYWQSEKYFLNISLIIRHGFIFPDFSCIEAKNMANRIAESPSSISIHIRRGDYVENPVTNNYHGVCPPDYYNKALQIIINKNKGKEIPELYIFSDDPDWVKENFDTCGLPSVVVDIQDHKEKPYHDMHLMSLCQHHIIANSSFSWWGAWLSSGEGVVVAPKCWFAENKMKDYNPSPASWIKI